MVARAVLLVLPIHWMRKYPASETKALPHSGFPKGCTASEISIMFSRMSSDRTNSGQYPWTELLYVLLTSNVPKQCVSATWEDEMTMWGWTGKLHAFLAMGFRHVSREILKVCKRLEASCTLALGDMTSEVVA